MIRAGIPALLAAALLACATPRPAVEKSDGSRPLVQEAVTREYTVPMDRLVKACLAACRDVGADHCKPDVKLDDVISSIVVCSETRAYALLLLPANRSSRIDVLLIIEDRATPGSQAPYDEFWAALEARLE